MWGGKVIISLCYFLCNLIFVSTLWYLSPLIWFNWSHSFITRSFRLHPLLTPLTSLSSPLTLLLFRPKTDHQVRPLKRLKSENMALWYMRVVWCSRWENPRSLPSLITWIQIILPGLLNLLPSWFQIICKKKSDEFIGTISQILEWFCPLRLDTHILGNFKLLSKHTLSLFFLPGLRLPATDTMWTARPFADHTSLLPAEWQAATSNHNYYVPVSLLAPSHLPSPYPLFPGEETC